MTDLLQILPSFPHPPFAALLPAIEHHGLTTTDLLALHPADIAKQTRLPLLDLKRFIAAVQASLSDDLAPPQQPLLSLDEKPAAESNLRPDPDPDTPSASASAEPPLPVSDPVPEPTQTGLISTLDHGLDEALGGGIPVGVVSEIAGESGAGKTQALLGLCLAVQLPPPHGLGRQALYISTEAPLATRRLAQMLANNHVLQSVEPEFRPSLDAIHSAVTPDLETQDHILEYQVPVLLSRHDVGLIVLDSVAANYRAEFERQGSRGSNMAARSAELVRLGALLRDLARRHNLAVVVANQVADRFSSSAFVSRNPPPRSSGAVPESPLASRSMPPPSSTNFSGTPSSPVPFALQDPDGPPPPPALLLDHQQRWFTGWGDDPHSSHSLKTPSLGLVWSTQIACRIALLKRPVYGRTRQAAPLDAEDDYSDLSAPTLKAWQRWMKVVFAPHAPASGQGLEDAVEYEVTMGGLKAVPKKRQKSKK
ncbi:P-loop containing nucleoside triphosphate hydrolase protein [Thelonectria olida]|uniref:P-loop containing nucleoside triphosphate hydrolase protein n=1 Tax=Thelonectria olida TaxID=1576542 RepID=A0A9P8WG57_9HYPO|nr:P-loop containing nucleoside triphosphate hydrolase protein [Thelonectria olida]